MQSVCGACLCEERPLQPLSSPSARHLYAQTLAQDQRCGQECEAVCWECAARLNSFVRFQRHARLCHRMLLDTLQSQWNGWTQASIARPPRLQVHCAPSVACDGHEDYTGFTDFPFQVKSEPERPCDALSMEIVNPEPVDIVLNAADRADSDSVDGLPIVQLKKKKKRKKAKKSLQKKKPKKVQKPEPIADDVSSDALSDLGSLLDLYEDEPVQGADHESDATKSLEEQVQVLQLTEAEMQAERVKLASSAQFLKRPHKCMQCIRPFRSAHALQLHRDTRHAESAGDHVCAVCGVRFGEAGALAEHALRHVRRVRCALCGRTCTSRKAYTEHALTHQQHQCHLCSQVSGSLSAHRAHVSLAHAGAGAGAGERERPQCVECGKMFSSRKTYRYHLNVIHRGQNRYPCPHCGKVYQWKSNLWRHIKNHKARDSGELYCGECDKRFSSVATYQQHLKASRRHVAESDFSHACEECGRRFATKTRLRDHVDWDHKQKVNYRCPTCDKPFKSNTSLYVHLANVHRAKGERANLCEVCGKSYQNLAKLKYHIVAMHTTQTPYHCAQPLCGAAFSWYSSLYRHQREVHDKVKLKKPKKAKKDSVPAPAPAPAPPPP